MMYGDYRQLTEEELARAIHLDPEQIAGLGPSIDYLRAMLEDRKRKILASMKPNRSSKRLTRHTPSKPNLPTHQPPCVAFSNVRWTTSRSICWKQFTIRTNDDTSPFAQQLVQVIARLGDKYQVDELASKYDFTGVEKMTVPEAIEIKEELEKIDELLKQLEEARKTAQIAIIDMEKLGEFFPPKISTVLKRCGNKSRTLSARWQNGKVLNGISKPVDTD